MTAGILGMIVSPLIGLGSAMLNPFVGFLLWIGGSWLSGVLIQRGKRLRARGAVKVLVEDPRPPVLYLRSFRADQKTAEKVGRTLSVKGVDLTIATTEEEQIATVVGRVGPLVAIGRPDETLPLLGAARMYVADDEWQARVLDIMHRAGIVLMRAGATEGFWWEVEQAVRDVPPERLLWLVPFSNANYRTFAARANTVLPKPLPLEPGKLNRGVGSLKAWIWFSPDWTPHVELPRPMDFHVPGYPVAVLLQRALAPFFVRMGNVSASLYGSTWKRVAAAIVDCTVVGLLCLAFLPFADTAAGSSWIPALLLLAAFGYLVILDLPIFGGTLGKRFTKMRVVDREGRFLSNPHAFLRGLLKCCLFPVAAFYWVVMIGWTVRHQMPHDLLTGTYVVDPAG